MTFEEKLFNPEKGLFKHKVFWLSVFLPFLAGVLLGIPVWAGYELSLTKAGYDTFYDLSKLPLMIMALALPFGAIVARFHRTMQSARQIKDADNRDKYLQYKDALMDFNEQVKSCHLVMIKLEMMKNLVNYCSQGQKLHTKDARLSMVADELMDIYKELMSRDLFLCYSRDFQHSLRAIHGHINGITRSLYRLDSYFEEDLKGIQFFWTQPLANSESCEKLICDIDKMLDEIYKTRIKADERIEELKVDLYGQP